MRTKNELYQEALRTVARRRQTARAKAEDARAEAEAAVPGLRHAEEEVRVRGIRCALAGAAGKDRTDAAAALTDARKKLADLLASSGRPADALEPHFTCRLCEDTGIVDGHTCSCVHKVMQQLPPVGDRGSVQPLHFQLRYHGATLLSRPDGHLPRRAGAELYVHPSGRPARLRRRI